MPIPEDPNEPREEVAPEAQLMLGKYHALALVGRGGMASVHLAVARSVGSFSKLLVVKSLRPELRNDPEVVAMFLDEARLSARLDHPNIVHTYEFAEENGTYYLAMEHLDGQPLDRFIARVGQGQPMDPAIALLIVRDALAGLHHAHSLRALDGTPLGVVHRDVSPQNLVVTYAGLVKLVDFGIAKAEDGFASTGLGILKGKIAYMAPEQALGEHVDRRTDVFACGVVLFELLSGRRFFGDIPEALIASKLVHGEIPRLRELVPDISRALERIVNRATEADRNARYDSAEAMLLDVEAVLAGTLHRASARDLARITSEAFAAERLELDRYVATQLVKLDRGERTSTRTSLSGVTFGTPTNESDLAHTRIAQRREFDPESVATVASGRAYRRTTATTLRWPRYAAFAALAIGAAASVALSVGEDPASPEAAGTAPMVARASADGCAREDGPVVRISGDIDESATLTCDKVYRLEHLVFVRNGVTLTIAPGTRIVGDAESDGTLVVEQGGKLEALGTRTQPIVFTSERPRDAAAAGDWGGVILLGRAPTNLHTRTGEPRTGHVEGILERGEYGGSLPDDSSGTLTYVRIEYGGTKLGPNNEINGLTLAGVGRGTRIDHVQVRSTKDDCFEFFGGTVDAHHLICDSPGDDGFDWDNGYAGRLQFLLFRDRESADGNHGFEGDNDADGARSPVSNPTIANVTLCGADASKESYALMLRHGTSGTISNLVASGFRALVDVRDHFADARVRAFAVVGPVLPLALVEGEAEGLPSNDDYGFDELAWLAPDAPGDASAYDACTDALTAAVPEAAAATPPEDGFFDVSARYRGAFRGPTDRWDAEPWAAPFP